MQPRTPSPPPLALAAVVPLAVGAAFWLPALGAARGWFPAPLDDVYIHFDFARSLAEGHPFEWIPGQGYSSGETSPLYAVILAAGWLLGLRGRLIGLWAAFVAIVSLVALVRSVQRLVRPCPAWLAWLVSAVPLSLGVVDWTLVSGMEVAPLCAALGWTIVALDRTRTPARGGPTREGLQWRLGMWGAALVLLRPEAAVLVGVFAVIAARGARARSGVAALARAALPGAIATLAVLAANHFATGDARSAGAQLKLLSSNPYLSEIARARVFVENLVTFFLRGLRDELSAVRALSLLVPALAVVALAPRARRGVGVACLGGALGWTILVSWNGTAPFQNFRYYAPGLVLVLMGAALGLAAVARRSRAAAGALSAVVIVLAGARVPEQVAHFVRCVANVRGQQVEVGARLARSTPPGARVLLGDAGAIPFVSRRSAIDALGLGGYRAMPFARAAVHGEAATLELIERLDPADRPTHLALYPNWFSAITSRFGVEIDRVTIQDNLICGGPTKGIYRADWRALEAVHRVPPGAVDEIDVADVVSEDEHAYVPPVPDGGWTTLDVLTDATGALRFDGGRVIPEGRRETFVIARAPAHGQLQVIVRVDGAARAIRAHARGSAVELVLDPPRDGAWRSATATLEGVASGDVVELEANRGAYRDYHVWLVDQARARAGD